jgi:hypothetical protein
MKQTHAQTDQAKKRRRPTNKSRAKRRLQSHQAHQQPPSLFKNNAGNKTNLYSETNINTAKLIKKQKPSRGSNQTKQIHKNKSSRTKNNLFV